MAGATAFSKPGGKDAAVIEFVEGALAYVADESGSRRICPPVCVELEVTVGSETPGETRDGCKLCEASTLVGSTGWPKNLATLKPTTTRAVAKKIF
jgi:hypothetical protein